VGCVFVVQLVPNHVLFVLVEASQVHDGLSKAVVDVDGESADPVCVCVCVCVCLFIKSTLTFFWQDKPSTLTFIH
jgi:hypothetical protein